MATTSTSTSSVVAIAEPVFTSQERLALAGYTGLTREAYVLDPRQYAAWCHQRDVEGALKRHAARVSARPLATGLKAQGSAAQRSGAQPISSSVMSRAITARFQGYLVNRNYVYDLEHC